MSVQFLDSWLEFVEITLICWFIWLRDVNLVDHSLNLLVILFGC